MSFVDETFGPGGHLARAFPGYESRPSQIALSKAIEEAIRDGESLLAEAPTGTGKGQAYLVPAVAHAIRSGSRVLVVTANIVLQEQLIKKDLPALAAALPEPFEYGLAKGRSNYLCLATLDDTLAERAIVGGRRDEEGIEAVIEWAGRTEEGDLSELPFEPTPQLRRLFTIASEDCLGTACPRREECHPNKARAKLGTAKIVVANYHLFFSDLQVRAASDGEARILPDFDVVILDEAHRCADIARDFFGFRITPGSVRWAARLLSGSPAKAGKGGTPEIDPALKDRLILAADRFFDALRSYAKSDAYKARLREDDPVRSDELLALLDHAARSCEQAAEREALDPAGRKKLRQAAGRCDAIGANVGAAMKPGTIRDVAFFVEADEGSLRVALCSKPIDVSGRLREALFESPTIRSTIATSATLTTGASTRSSDFEFVAGEIGAELAREIVVESPFDFAGRCLFVVPEEFDVCLPNEKKFAEECARLFSKIATLARGRTLGLFTTRRAMDAAFDEIDRIRGRAFAVMKQGQMPRSELVRRFREDVSSVLIGTASLWEGVDVPGEALSCVVVDKLPFPPPDDPVLDAIDARERDAFGSHMLPRALIAFRQGAGRLIRSKTDRGVIICLDRRIVEKGYGKRFIKALPLGVRVSRRIEDVAEFLDGTSEHHAELHRNEQAVEGMAARPRASIAETIRRASRRADPFAPEIDAGLRAIVRRRRG